MSLNFRLILHSPQCQKHFETSLSNFNIDALQYMCCSMLGEQRQVRIILIISYCMLAGNMWSRFVTVYREDQDALHAEAKRQNVKIITSNYSASPSAPLQHPDGPASQYAA